MLKRILSIPVNVRPLLLPAVISLFSPALLLAATLPLPDSQQVLHRIAFGSCAFQSVEQPIYRSVVVSKPDLYLSLGDAIYADYDLDTREVYPVTAKTLRREWRVLADNPGWQHLVTHVPVMATWDNHDYGHHSAGAEFPLKNVSAEIFLDFFGESQNSARRLRPGIYDAKIFGPVGKRVQIILLDTRSFKSPPIFAERASGSEGSLGKYAPNADNEATLLGATQWQWLDQQLQKPAEIRLIASSGQIIADQKGMDEWGNYPRERQRLFDTVADSDPSGVILLSGNAHFAEISSTTVQGDVLVDFTSSGLTHVNTKYAQADNRYRVAGPYAAENFGLVEIEWGGDGAARVTLAGVNIEGEKVFEHSLEIAPN